MKKQTVNDIETIEIVDFGPIKDIKIKIKDINVFIGPTSTGKSTVAKLISIFKNQEFVESGSVHTFKKLLMKYNIDFEIKNDAYIKYSNGKYFWKFQNNEITDNFPFKGIVTTFRPIIKSIFLSNERIDKEYNGKTAVAILFLTSIDFDNITVESKKVMDEKVLSEISDLLDKIKNNRNEIVHNNYTKLDETIELFNQFISKIKHEMDIYDPLYVPAERILLSMVGESLFGLIKNDVSLADCLKDFGSRFESARKQLKKHELSFLEAKYEYDEKTNYIIFKDGAKIKLEQASSGFQSVIPLLLVIEYFIHRDKSTKHCLVVEEPELNLYPTIQKALLEYLVEKVNESHDKLIVTTHSPYLLTTLDNLIQAKNVADADQSRRDEVKNIIPEKYWVSFDRVACYYFDKGTCYSTLDEELKTIGATKIDDVSEELGKTFEELLELKYSPADEL